MIAINRHPSDRTLRQFGAIFLPLFLALLGVLTRGHEGSGYGVGALMAAAAASVSLGLLRPRALGPIFVGMLYATYPIGWFVSHVVLLAIFFLCLTPLGLAARLVGRDRMQRCFDRTAPTYWVKRRPRTDAGHYVRPY